MRCIATPLSKEAVQHIDTRFSFCKMIAFVLSTRLHGVFIFRQDKFLLQNNLLLVFQTKFNFALGLKAILNL